MNLLRFILFCFFGILTFLSQCEAGRSSSSRGGSRGSSSRPSSSSSSWFSSRPSSKPSPSSSTSWFSSRPSPTPVISRPSPTPSYGWNVPSPSRPSISNPASLSYTPSYGWGSKPPASTSGWGSNPSVSNPNPFSPGFGGFNSRPPTVKIPNPVADFYNIRKPPKISSPPYTASKPFASAPPLPSVSRTPSKPLASAPPLPSVSNPKPLGKPIGWNVPKPSSPIGPPPAYPGLGKGTSGSNVAPPVYSRYTPKSQAPAYGAPSHATRPNPPVYTATAPVTASQGVRPYGNAGVQGANYPRQTYTSVPASQTQYGYPNRQYGTTANQPVGYGQGSYGYGQGGYGHAAPVGPPVYNHYGGSAGYGYPAGGYASGPTIINNHYGGGGFGGYGGYGGYGGGYSSGGGSSIGSHLLTAGLFYGLGRVTSPSYGYGGYHSGFGSGGYSSSRHTETTNIHNTYNNYYDHGSTTTSTVLPPLQVAAADTNNNQSPVVQQQQPTQQQQGTTQNQGASPMDVYLSQPKDPYGVIIPSNTTNNETVVQQGQDNNPAIIIPRTVDLTKQKIFEPVEVPYDQVSKHKINEQPLWLNESVIRLPVYGYNFPTWNESTVVSAALIAVPTDKPPIPNTTLKPSEPEPTGLGAKIGKMFYNVVNWFSSGYQRDDPNARTPQVYLEDETFGRPEAEMVKKMPEEYQTTTEKQERTPPVEHRRISYVIDEALAKAKADIEKIHSDAGISSSYLNANETEVK